MKGLVKKLGKFDAEALFCQIKGREKWQELANSEDENVRLKALIYLTDRAYGKVTQPISGPEGGPIRASIEVAFVSSDATSPQNQG